MLQQVLATILNVMKQALLQKGRDPQSKMRVSVVGEAISGSITGLTQAIQSLPSVLTNKWILKMYKDFRKKQSWVI